MDAGASCSHKDGTSSITDPSSFSFSMLPADEEAGRLLRLALSAGARPIFENPQGALVEVRFALSPEVDDEDMDEERFNQLAAVERIRLFGWMEEIGVDGEMVQAVRSIPSPAGTCSPKAEEETSDDGKSFEVIGLLTLRLHLWSTPHASRFNQSKCAEDPKLEDTVEGKDNPLSKERRYFLDQRDDSSITRKAASAVISYASLLSGEDPKIISESVYESKTDSNSGDNAVSHILQFQTAEAVAPQDAAEGQKSSTTRS